MIFQKIIDKKIIIFFITKSCKGLYLWRYKAELEGGRRGYVEFFNQIR